jgi:hypothetical protein
LTAKCPRAEAESRHLESRTAKLSEFHRGYSIEFAWL